MSKITITEALAELKTIGKRLEVKRGNLAQYLARDARVKDPLEKDGGSAVFITRERQSISDLETRIIAIRIAIQSINLSTNLTLGDKSMSLQEWLTWRREVAQGQKALIVNILNTIRGLRLKVQKETGAKLLAASNEGEASMGDIIVNVDEQALLKEQETIETLLGDLDGKLSLLNATTTIDVT